MLNVYLFIVIILLIMLSLFMNEKYKQKYILDFYWHLREFRFYFEDEDIKTRMGLIYV